ncbi:MAG: hypothetical protein L6R39_007128 [Caloplaca ligustica]|nr:MAG: hypothetical protein L6R39_007128 [Caloplaca ligustica]
MAPLRIGYVPEHFSTPLHFAQTHFSLSAHLIPFPSGTGHMVTSLRSGDIDVAVGLTEGWIAALASSSSPTPNAGAHEHDFKIVGTYVESPLCWAISTGRDRDDVSGIDDLRGKRMGVSRVGSGSYVMGFVLADQQGWLQQSPSSSSFDGGDSAQAPFDVKPLQNFENLRKAVNDGTADFFMWEYFTSKRYYGASRLHPIKQVGEIYTPWSSWKIVAQSGLAGTGELNEVFEKVNAGIKYFGEHQEEAVRYISQELDYEEGDAREWLKTVRFAEDVRGVKRSVVEKTVGVLRKAGVVRREGWAMEEGVGFVKEEG